MSKNIKNTEKTSKTHDDEKISKVDTEIPVLETKVDETKDVSTKATIKVTKGEISAICSFDVNLEDYKINIPSIAKEKLSSTAKIKVECNYAALKK
jgi:hypothetical protein